MLSNYSIDYIALPQHNDRVLTHHTEDPIQAEDFLMHLLSAGARIKEIRHEGVALTNHQADKMIKVAAERIAALMLRRALDIDTVSVIHRFGFTA